VAEQTFRRTLLYGKEEDIGRDNSLLCKFYSKNNLLFEKNNLPLQAE
jgi:hypothetical protein